MRYVCSAECALTQYEHVTDQPTHVIRNIAEADRADSADSADSAHVCYRLT